MAFPLGLKAPISNTKFSTEKLETSGSYFLETLENLIHFFLYQSMN